MHIEVSQRPNNLGTYRYDVRAAGRSTHGFRTSPGAARDAAQEDGGFMYLVAIIDWYSRYVLAWGISNTLDTQFCLTALERALRAGRRPDIFNTDQGVQFTCSEFVARLESEGIRISMDGRGRYLDNIFVERLWRSVKYEDIYLKNYSTGLELGKGMGGYFGFYNTERPHQALSYGTPLSVYTGALH